MLFLNLNRLWVIVLGSALSWAAAAQAPVPVPAPAPAPTAAVNSKPPTEAAPAKTPPVTAPVPGALKPLKEVLLGATALPGLLKLHQKDDKVWIELLPEQFNQLLFFSYNVPRSVGERGLYGGQMGRSNAVVFRKVGNQVQLIAKNTEFFAKEGSPQAQFVSESFSDSLLASAPVVAADPESKAVVIEAQTLLMSDIPGYLTRLESAFRMPFALDTRNSSFAALRNTPQLTGLEVQAHFSVARLSAPPSTPSPMPFTPPPMATPDPRSLFVNFYYSFTNMPEPMAARVADERVGYFTVGRVDYTEDTSVKLRRHVIKRWRLEKANPAAAMSPPQTPVLYWLDKNIPEKYRQAVTDGVLEWNKAFEKIGFQGALQVKQQLASDDFNTSDARHASIRWFSGADVGFAIGPSQADPRTGEILDADIGMSDVFARGARRTLAEDFERSASRHQGHGHGHGGPVCNHAQDSAHELHFAMDWLESQGLSMDSPQAEKLAQLYVKAVIMHEVGHTLGLRHNFRASTAYSLAQMQDPRFTREYGLSSSVMDYLPFNISPANENQGDYVTGSLGAYDYWAIAYGYSSFETAQETAGLAKITAQSTRPELAFATDEDAGYGSMAEGIDPDVNRFDLGSDPLAYYKRRMTLSRQLWDRLQTLQLTDGESYERLTRSFNSGFRGLSQVGPLAAKFVGGVLTRRDRAGSGRPLFEAVPAARQREALQLITQNFFRAESFRFDPALLARLAPDAFDRKASPEVSVVASVLAVQRSILDPLFSPTVASRLLEAPLKAAKGVAPLSLAQLHDTLQNAIWSEALQGQDAGLLRRNLQREHLRRMTDVLIKPSSAVPPDARSLLRMNAQILASQLQKALARGGLGKEAQAHFSESLNTLQTALQAQVQRAGL
ncbi:zinc-dependent metalloprotease [Limnohabitans sp. Rim8]|uniref:zinc-dependent metalloprotease n=1 Tax=Limnohabitans sp. Rim8 TaxID=1100718 RepID=UPI003305FFA8